MANKFESKVILELTQDEYEVVVQALLELRRHHGAMGRTNNAEFVAQLLIDLGESSY